MQQSKKTSERLISPEMTVAETLAQKPAAVLMFTRRKMGCPGCSMAGFDTLQDVALIYQIPVKDLIKEILEAG